METASLLDPEEYERSQTRLQENYSFEFSDVFPQGAPGAIVLAETQPCFDFAKVIGGLLRWTREWRQG